MKTEKEIKERLRYYNNRQEVIISGLDAPMCDNAREAYNNYIIKLDNIISELEWVLN